MKMRLCIDGQQEAVVMYRGPTGACCDILIVDRRLWLCLEGQQEGRQEANVIYKLRTGGCCDIKRADRGIWAYINGRQEAMGMHNVRQMSL